MGAAALIIMLSAIQFSLVLLRNIAVVVMRLTSAIALPLVRSQLEHNAKGVKQPGPKNYALVLVAKMDILIDLHNTSYECEKEKPSS